MTVKNFLAESPDEFIVLKLYFSHDCHQSLQKTGLHLQSDLNLEVISSMIHDWREYS